MLLLGGKFHFFLSDEGSVFTGRIQNKVDWLVVADQVNYVGNAHDKAGFIVAVTKEMCNSASGSKLDHGER